VAPVGGRESQDLIALNKNGDRVIKLKKEVLRLFHSSASLLGPKKNGLIKICGQLRKESL
jgi:hypothetical protein